MAQVRGKFRLVAATILLSLTLCVLGAELLLRVIPNEFHDRYRQYRRFGTTNPTLLIHHVDREKVGYVYQADSRGKGKTSPCYHNDDISTNSQGYNDGEWTAAFDAEPFKIAVLGDSFVAAMEVPSSENSVALMRELSGLPFMNAGVNGYQPPQELDTYRATVSPHRPQLVLAYFYLGNDVNKSLCHFQRKPSCYDVGPGGGYEMRYAPFSVASHASKPQQGLAWSLGRVLGRHLVLTQVVRKFMPAVNDGEGGDDALFNLYMAQPTEPWSRSWMAFEQVVRDLKSAVEADGGKLAVVLVPTHGEISPDWRREIAMQYMVNPAELDNDRPLIRMEETLGRVGVPFINPVPFMRDYLRRQALPYPYFSMRCDGHWNPLGHYLMANLILVRGIEMGLIPRPELLEQLRGNLQRPARDITGETIYRQLFVRGGYYDASDKVKR